ncbi:hypothetical protein [Microbacter margulisiae]|uniref:Uncharacterized protein n=1 Tax=Microbacter margulisiae TaxID=1350067 RepID=A0A7W5H1W4_9PORP|nr:hypothetical protein [Microbacter margulisiae]MBB3186797.1 hypothetical protein [Microbacter margulisiae]
MEHNFTEDVKTKSDKKLKEIVIHFDNYQEALISAAENELANRGIELSDEEKRTIEIAKQKMVQETIKKQETDEDWDAFHPKWKQNIVKDENAPQLYSRRVINIFSILFCVLFGGILLAIQLSQVK